MNFSLKDAVVIGIAAGAGYVVGFKKGFYQCRHAVEDLFARVIAKSDVVEQEQNKEES